VAQGLGQIELLDPVREIGRFAWGPVPFSPQRDGRQEGREEVRERKRGKESGPRTVDGHRERRSREELGLCGRQASPSCVIGGYDAQEVLVWSKTTARDACSAPMRPRGQCARRRSNPTRTAARREPADGGR